MDETLRLEVPIQLKNAPKIEHTMLEQPLAQVEIECLPKDIPEAIVAVVSDMKEGEFRKVGTLVAAAGRQDPDRPGGHLRHPEDHRGGSRGPAAAAVPAEGAAVEPEVIGRKVAEEGEEEVEEKPRRKEEVASVHR